MRDPLVILLVESLTPFQHLAGESVALTALRKAVRQHVQDERERGAALSEIELGLRAIIARVLEDAAGRDSIDGERDALANQMMKWSQGFYEAE